MMKVLLLSVLSFVSVSAFGGDVTVRFPLQLWTTAEVSSSISKGDRVTIDYDRMRFKEIVDRQLQARTGTNYIPGWAFASGYHCYGYGCCAYSVPNVEMYVRFNSNDSFVRYDIAATSSQPILTVPHGAEKLELYFRIERFHIAVWYCGGGPTTGTGGGSTLQIEAYDSFFGNNYVFGVN